MIDEAFGRKEPNSDSCKIYTEDLNNKTVGDFQYSDFGLILRLWFQIGCYLVKTSQQTSQQKNHLQNYL